MDPSTQILTGLRICRTREGLHLREHGRTCMAAAFLNGAYDEDICEEDVIDDFPPVIIKDEDLWLYWPLKNMCQDGHMYISPSLVKVRVVPKITWHGLSEGWDPESESISGYRPRLNPKGQGNSVLETEIANRHLVRMVWTGDLAHVKSGRIAHYLIAGTVSWLTFSI